MKMLDCYLSRVKSLVSYSIILQGTFEIYARSDSFLCFKQRNSVCGISKWANNQM